MLCFIPEPICTTLQIAIFHKRKQKWVSNQDCKWMQGFLVFKSTRFHHIWLLNYQPKLQNNKVLAVSSGNCQCNDNQEKTYKLLNGQGSSPFHSRDLKLVYLMVYMIPYYFNILKNVSTLTLYTPLYPWTLNRNNEMERILFPIQVYELCFAFPLL